MELKRTHVVLTQRGNRFDGDGKDQNNNKQFFVASNEQNINRCAGAVRASFCDSIMIWVWASKSSIRTALCTQHMYRFILVLNEPNAC